MNYEKDILRHIVRKELKDNQNMEMFTTEDSRNDSVEVMSNTAIMGTRLRYLLPNLCSSRKRMANNLSFEQLGYTDLL